MAISVVGPEGALGPGVNGAELACTGPVNATFLPHEVTSTRSVHVVVLVSLEPPHPAMLRTSAGQMRPRRIWEISGASQISDLHPLGDRGRDTEVNAC